MSSRNNQERRYGVKIEDLSDATGKSVPTIYNWQRTNPALLDAAAQHQRNTQWSSATRQQEALSMLAGGLDMHLHGAIFDAQDSPFGTFQQFMLFLSGVDLWHLRAAHRKATAELTGENAVYLDMLILEDAIDLQLALIQRDIAVTRDISQSLSTRFAMAEDYPDVTAGHLTRLAMTWIDGERKIVQADLTPTES